MGNRDREGERHGECALVTDKKGNECVYTLIGQEECVDCLSIHSACFDAFGMAKILPLIFCCKTLGIQTLV
jgi:hypothetical protein